MENERTRKFMPKITITPEDLLKGQLHEPGWFKGEIVFATAKPSKDKQSMNYEYGLSYDTGDKRPGYEKREITSRFNSQAVGFMIPFLAALSGLPEKEFRQKALQENKEIDIIWDDSLKGQKIQFEIKNVPRNDNGQLKSDVVHFAPYDYKVPF